MSEKGWGKTVLGWFVVEEGASQRQPAATSSESEGRAPADAADALIAKYAAEPAPAPPPVELRGPLPPVVDGAVDFDQVFELGGVDAGERDRVTKARDLLRSLPAETPVLVKKQIVEASLKAFGVPTEKIIEAAVQEMEALEAFIRKGQQETQDILSQGTARIAELEAQIAEVKSAMHISVGQQEARTVGANKKKLEVQEVLEFFGQEAVARVVIESPKLHEPT
jgi:hypothetical protein